MPDALAAVLLRRRRLVDAARLTPPVRRSAWQWLRHPLTTQAGLAALQLLFIGLILLVFGRILELLGGIRAALETKPATPAGE